jgi:hypothetical protein
MNNGSSAILMTSDLIYLVGFAIVAMSGGAMRSSKRLD